MIEIKGDIWEYYDKDNWIVIPTNMRTDRFERAIMGVGLALDARKRFPDLSKVYGKHLLTIPREIFLYKRMFMSPTKVKPKDDSKYEVIADSAKRLADIGISWSKFEQANRLNMSNIYLPRVGCGCGKLIWKDVKKILEPILDDRFIVVSKQEKYNDTL